MQTARIPDNYARRSHFLIIIPDVDSQTTGNYARRTVSLPANYARRRQSDYLIIMPDAGSQTTDNYTRRTVRLPDNYAI